ncbi:MAG TPA: hypothetical protein VN541_25095 [Tepidisphaeraceae bacterium]|nr:hypothetical protein [Tepidisphaeraceae bacterium]
MIQKAWLGFGLVAIIAGCQPHSAPPSAQTGPRPVATGETAPDSTAAGAAATTRPSSTSGREFTSVPAMFDVIPATFLSDASGNWTDLKIAAANRVLAREVLGHPAKLTARVKAAGIAPGTFDRRLTGLPRTHLSQPAIGETPVTLYAYFPKACIEHVATINPGEQITVSGAVSRAELTREPNGHGVRLNVDLGGCQIAK